MPQEEKFICKVVKNSGVAADLVEADHENVTGEYDYGSKLEREK